MYIHFAEHEITSEERILLATLALVYLFLLLFVRGEPVAEKFLTRNYFAIMNRMLFAITFHRAYYPLVLSRSYAFIFQRFVKRN